jgi:hypothetical protein
MALETATYIHELNQSNPVGATDPKSQGDDHIRLLKTTTQNTWPNVEGAVLATHGELNILAGATLDTAELNKLDGLTATQAELANTDRDADYAVTRVGYLGLPNNDQSANYGIVAADNGKLIRHPLGAGGSDVYTIPSNAGLALPIGFCFSLINLESANVSIAITTDTLRWGTTQTGTRTVAQYGLVTCVKVDTTIWKITGDGIS